MNNVLLDNDTLFIFGLLLLSGLEALNVYVSIAFGIAGTIFAIVKTIDIIRNWKKEKKNRLYETKTT